MFKIITLTNVLYEIIRFILFIAHHLLKIQRERVTEQIQQHSYTMHTLSTLLSFYNCHTENNVELKRDCQQFNLILIEETEMVNTHQAS
jgi:hypothetical protein